jgi:hypothetical protein
MLKPRIKAALEDYLDNDCEYLNGNTILDAEFPLRKSYQTGPALSGIADLVLTDDEGGYVVRDYKAKTMPDPKDLWANDDDFPKNVQMASYVTMLETSSEERTVKDARFYSIDNRKFQPVIDEEKYPHSDYEKEIASVDIVVEKTAAAMRDGEYMVPKSVSRVSCAECAVSSVCRKVYIGEK